MRGTVPAQVIQRAAGATLCNSNVARLMHAVVGTMPDPMPKSWESFKEWILRKRIPILAALTGLLIGVAVGRSVGWTPDIYAADVHRGAWWWQKSVPPPFDPDHDKHGIKAWRANPPKMTDSHVMQVLRTCGIDNLYGSYGNLS